MSEIRTEVISPARLSRSLSKFLGKTEQRPETMEHISSECLGRGEIILRPGIKITKYIDVSWGKSFLEGFEGASKEKAYIARKNVLKFK